MSTWHLCSDNGSNYRWEAISPNLPSKLDDDPKSPPIVKYPSMVDLLIEGCSKLIENDDRGVDKYPMFRTEIANSVALKESSIAKAIYILNEDDVASTDTPSGRSLSVSSEALQRTMSLLGEPDVGDLFDRSIFSPGTPVPREDVWPARQNNSNSGLFDISSGSPAKQPDIPVRRGSGAQPTFGNSAANPSMTFEEPDNISYKAASALS
ncbi:hypothetical protein F3Y22_tig00110331pilonHSYRG00102 [Hibiscus syriacus]|uniref:Uncharacterized protein n=1 Tax=Hibiscus syriacus TaxID=106335 RepID=A0A6A3B0U5_HIBSY|nr:hypothetical protein F3Y22_tig00110331pilonHSYRG00102 [Hibiscus syriacus]